MKLVDFADFFLLIVLGLGLCKVVPVLILCSLMNQLDSKGQSEVTISIEAYFVELLVFFPVPGHEPLVALYIFQDWNSGKVQLEFKIQTLKVHGCSKR